MKGSASALKWANRDVGDIDQVLPHLRGRTAVVQAGGSLGVYPKRLAELFDTVYTFEPSATVFPLLVQNVPALNVIKIQAALGFRRELVGTSQTRRDGKPDNHEGITHIVPRGVIPTFQIDDLNLPACEAIFLDVEGYEMEALRGAEETIRRCRPALVVEINKNLAYAGLTVEDMHQYLHGLGYRWMLTLHSDELFVLPEYE